MIRWCKEHILLIGCMLMLATSSISEAQSDAGADDAEWQENVRAFNEALDSSLFPGDDPDNGAKALIDVMKRVRAIKELQELAVAYENLIVHGDDDVVDEEAALRSEVARRRLELTDEVVKELREALKAEYCDFGVDHSAGVGMLLPHLAPMREIARLLALRVKVLIRENEWKEAGDSLSDLLELSKVARRDRTAISSLVGASIAGIGLGILDEAMTEQRLDARSAMPFRMATMYLESDPFGFRDAALGEYEMMKGSTSYLLDGQDREIFAAMASERSDQRYLMEIDEDSFLSELEEARVVYEMLGDALEEGSEEEIADRVNAIMADVMRNAYGPLARMLLVPWERIVFNMVRTTSLHSYISESLRQITRGADPGYFGNAMTLYRRCLPELSRLSGSDQETMAMVRRILLVSGTCDALPDSLRERLNSIFEMLRPLRTTILRAAKIRRCHDPRTRISVLEAEGFSEGRHLRGMQAAGRLLLTEAALGICQHEDGLDTGEQVSESLVGALGIATHMADGSHLMGQLAATALLEEIADLLELGVENGTIGESILPDLEERLRRSLGDDLLNWRKTERMLHGDEVLETVETFGMTDRDLSTRLVGGWSQDRLFLAQFYKGGRPALGDSPLSSPRFDYRPDGDRGALHSLEHIFNPSEDELLMLQGPHERLLQLLNAIDTVKSPRIIKWKARSFDAYQRIEALAKGLKPANPVHDMKKPERKKMNEGMDGMMGH